MNVRRAKKRAEQKLGHWDTVGFRTECGGPDPYTGKVWPRRTIRFTISHSRKFTWKEGP